MLLAVLLVAGTWWRYGGPTKATTPSPAPVHAIAMAQEPTSTPVPSPTPIPTGTPTVTTTPTLVYHIVSPGENLSVIANEYGVKVEDIVKANNLPSAQLIIEGQKLLIPEGYIPPTPTSGATSWALNYIVQEGDTLDYIALSFHVSMPTLVAANRFTSTVIHPGDVVIIPQGKPPKKSTPTPISGPSLLPTTPTEHKVCLLYPGDGAHLSEASPVLSWLAAGWLPDDEWYRVRIWKGGEEKPIADVLTRSTGWHMDESFRGPAPSRWRWRVEVVRAVVEPDGTPEPTGTIGNPSPLWTFWW